MRLFLANHFSQPVSFSFVTALVIAIFLGASCTPLPERDSIEAVVQFTIQEGFEIELFAAEPLIQDPVDMEIDEDGRLFVVEMPGYPLDLGRSGRIKQLIDTDQDGYPDQSIIFADSLLLPSGIMRWKKGFIVTDTPEVLYLEDSDGDGKADVREVLLTGFALSNPQHNLNNPNYGLDNWIYLANEGYFTTVDYKDLFGDEGAKVHFPGIADGPVLPQNAGDRNVRFKPDEGALEMCAASTQFGQAFDPWGHHFQTSNFHPLWHEVIAARYLQRNPDLLAAEATQYLPDEPINEVFPTSQSPEHQLLTDVGVITSGCGINWYAGGAFPKSFNEVLFLCEPVHNLVQANKITAQGPTFSAHRIQEGEEFLSSTDTWFRPSNTYIGPDGALYLIDYHRRIIEHPEWMSDEVNESGQLYEGTDKGRIYRITSTGAKPAKWLDQLALSPQSPLEWVPHLNDRNSWWRETAQRLIVNTAQVTKELVAAIKQVAASAEGQAGRVHALWTLEGLARTDTALLKQALADPEAGIRENAIQLAELHLLDYPALADDLLNLADDPNARVRFQLLCTLGDLEGAKAREVRERLLVRDLESNWTHLAALSATPGQELALFQWATEELANRIDEGGGDFIKNLSALIGRKGQTFELNTFIAQLQTLPANLKAFALSGLAQGVSGKTNGISVKHKEQLSTWSLDENENIRAASLGLLAKVGLPASRKFLNELQKVALERVANDKADEQLRADALHLLSILNTTGTQALFKDQIQASTPAVMQQASIRGLAQIKGIDNAKFLLGKWDQLTPSVRATLVSSFRPYPDRMHLFLTAIEAGTIAAQGIGPKQVFEILKNDDKSVRRRATLLFKPQEGEREAVLAQYQPTLDQVGDFAQGKMVFEAECASCHQLGGENGFPLGPDLASIRNRTKASILHDILIPNAAIADGYDVWTVKTTEEAEYSGIIAQESPSSITLRFLEVEDQVISRGNIERLSSAPTSLMTTGLEENIDLQEMANLLAFLKNQKKEDQSD
ncbi:MAG: c-type cytochrome [Saprospiraceae bacterium]|nr:c-type cytochrome [Saprospiraceae bacterium]